MLADQVFPNPLRAAEVGYGLPPSLSGELVAVPPGAEDINTGEIQCPRVAPHRFLVPTKSCLRPSCHPAQSPDRAMRRGVSFAHPRCIISGVPLPSLHRPRRRCLDVEDPQQGQCPPPRAKRSRFFRHDADWTSDCDEPMTGVSDEEDAVALSHREEEAELDRQHDLADRFALFNKGDCPIKSKRGRSRHPAVIESRARTSWPKPGLHRWSVPPPSR